MADTEMEAEWGEPLVDHSRPTMEDFSSRVDKVEAFDITFSCPEETYEAGKSVEGTVTLVLREAMKIASVRVQCYGKGKVRWFDSSATGDGADPVYRGQEVYIDKEVCLYESSGRHGDLIAKGTHTYPFSIPIPAEVPSSFEGAYGYIRYTCNGHVYRPGSTLPDYTYRRVISISRRLDLNDEPSEIRSVVVAEEVQPVSCCCCLLAGRVSVRFHMDRRAFVPGEDIRWKAEVRQDNVRMSVVKCCSVTVKQFVDYTGVSDAFFSSGRAKPHFQKLSVCSVHHAGPRQGEPMIWEGHMMVPPLPPSRLDGCKIMSIAYCLQFKAVINFGEDLKLLTNLVIGTVPMVNHFRPPPYTTEDNSDAHPASAAFVTTLPPAVTWNLPPPVYEPCTIRVAQKRLPDAEGELGESGVKFVPRYPVHRSQAIFSGPSPLINKNNAL